MADLLAVIRGTMGGHEYYIGKMTFQELAAKVQLYRDLDTSPDIDTLLQRRLSDRSQHMVDYLLRQPERFYGAIIVAAWGGHPQYVRVNMEDHPLLDDAFEFGLLKFDGKQEYFALDGQHRLESIKKAIEAEPALRHEEVSVLFVTHDRTLDGNIRTRRLFHTLNKNAKATTTGENVQLDEDNVVSIATRMLLRSGIVALNSTHLELVQKNVRNVDKFTSLTALYDFNMAVLDAVYSFRRDRNYLKFRPDASDVDQTYNALVALWSDLRHRIADLAEFEAGTRTPGEIREPNGEPAHGNLLFRPLGLVVFGNVVAAALPECAELPVAIGSEIDPTIWAKAWDRIGSLPLILGELPWRGTIFRNNRMENGARKLATRLACYMLDLDANEDVAKLLKEYCGHIDDEGAQLPDKLARD